MEAAIAATLAEAALLHHEFEEKVLAGAHDATWPAFYAAIVAYVWQMPIRTVMDAIEATPANSIDWKGDVSRLIVSNMGQA